MADLVVCCDGTWNTPDDVENGLPASTNVWKIHNALAEKNGDGAKIERYYHSGVGTEGGKFSRVVGGGLGAGLSDNVKSAYRWLAGVYQPGDRIFLFGFSRGAFTVRSLGGVITRCGLLKPAGLESKKLWAAVDAIYDDYREKNEPKATANRPLHNVAAGGKARKSTPIHFIGVWDTVGALGVPDDLAVANLFDDPTRYAFHDTALSDSVKFARHAIALDERRQSFTPTLWVDVPPEQNVKQAWFPGVHSDVGGGYSSCGLSDGALKWMMDEAHGAGLAFRDIADGEISPNPRGLLHNSLTGVFKSLKTRPREAPRFLDGDAPRKAASEGRETWIHGSAYERHDKPSLNEPSYWRTRVLSNNDSHSFDVFAREQWNRTGVYLEKGVTYAFSAVGAWRDAGQAYGPDGADDGKFQAGDVIRFGMSAVGAVEKFYERATGNAQADFIYTKRVEKIGWFKLTGMIASGEWFDEKGALVPRPLTEENAGKLTLNEYIEIGAKEPFTPKASGYLYCFANDAWQTYENNTGSVRLTVKRKP